MHISRARWLAAGAAALVTLGVAITPSGASSTASTKASAAKVTASTSTSANCAAPGTPPADAVKPPKFLKLPFSQKDGRDSLTITEGWDSSNDEIPFTGDYQHGALDFEFYNTPNHGYGLPIYAAASGKAYFSYQYISGFYTDPTGVKHQVGQGAGLFVEIQHGNGWVTQYIHLSKVAKGIPYVTTTEDPATPGDWNPTGIKQPRTTLLKIGVSVKQGQLIGYNGDTGIGLDYKDSWDPTTHTVLPRNRVALPPWDPTQLHFQLYHGRDVSGNKLGVTDVSGVYSHITASTNPYAANGKLGQLCIVPSRAAWQTGKNGQPLYAHS